MKSLTFNGIRKDWLYLLEGRQKAPFAPITRNLLKIPGRPGALLQSSEIEPLVIYQPIGFVVKNDIDALTKKDELASWLVTMEPVALEFDDEPGRIYYAVVQNTISDYEKFVRQRRGIIEFLVLDGFGYGPEHEVTFPSDVVTLTNEGTAEADPIFELEVLQPVTFAMVQNQDNEYMMIGAPQSVEQTPKPQEEIILNHNMNSTIGWTSGTYVDGGTVSGTMASNGYAFFAQDYGIGTNWHGPALKTSLSETLENFIVTAIVELRSTQPNQVGRVEIYLINEANEPMAKMAIHDASPNYELNYGWIRAGNITNGVDLINEYSDRQGGWNQFYGMLKIMRASGQWYAYIAKIDSATRKHHTTRIFMPTYFEGFDVERLAAIQVHIGAHSSYNPVTTALVHDIGVWKINSLGENEIPLIGQPGDIITFDHKTADILINGESKKDLKQFGASFFKLKKGLNQLVVMPSNSFNVKCKYRERYR